MRSRLITFALAGSCVLAVSLTASRATTASASNAIPGFASSTREQDANQQVAHVLSRLAFGARPGDVARVQSMGVDKWIDRQLHPERIDDAATDQFLARYETLALSSGDLYKQFPPAAAVRNAARRDSLQRSGRMTRADTIVLLQQARRSNQFVAELTSSRVARAVMSERQLQEVMVDFWENHFTVFAGKGQTRYYLTSYDRDVIRPNALGNFRTLLGAVAKSPAMLFYLDNAQSVADSGRATLRSQRRGGNRGAGTGNRRQGRGAGGAAPAPWPQRELRARAHGAAHARRRGRVHAEGCHRSRAGTDRLEHSPTPPAPAARARPARPPDGRAAAGHAAMPASSCFARRPTTPSRRSCSDTSSSPDAASRTARMCWTSSPGIPPPRSTSRESLRCGSSAIRRRRPSSIARRPRSRGRRATFARSFARS